MKKLISKGLVIAGMLSAPVTLTRIERPENTSEYKNDPRLASLKRFFQASDCPAQDFSGRIPAGVRPSRAGLEAAAELVPWWNPAAGAGAQ